MRDWLRARASTHAAVPALLDGVGIAWTFAELDARVDDAAAHFAALGIAAGDPVALLARNGPAFVVTVHALGRLGALLVPLNVRQTAVELARQLRDVGAQRVVHDAASAALARDAVAGSAVSLHPLGAHGPDWPERAVPRLRERIDLDAPHSVIYTSGTSGEAKGAMLDWGNFWWGALGSSLTLGHHHDDRWLAVLPLFHVGGLSILLRSAIHGIPVVVHDGFDPARANAAIDNDRVTIVSVVAVMLRRMFEARGTAPYPPWLRVVLLGGGPASRALLDDASARNVPVAFTYGMTETASQAATSMPSRTPAKPGSTGHPLLPVELQIAPDGEILVRGPTVTRGYVNRPEATAHAWRDGWFHTGDLGRLDEDGELYVLDRRDDLIVSGGENVYPAEVEAALLAHPSVAEAAVIGADDVEWGRVPVAIVRRHAGDATTAETLLRFAGERLARYKVPREIRWTETPLPRTAAGKLQRRLLAGAPRDERALDAAQDGKRRDADDTGEHERGHRLRE